MDDKQLKFEYLLHLGDNDLVLGHRISEWCGHGPVLEQDIALINVALDLLGQATQVFKYAAEIEGEGRDEDDLTFLRTERQYKNVLLVEQPNGHFGDTITRQFLFDVYHFYLLQELLSSNDKMISAIAEKALKEVSYHMKFSSEWMIRLGDGTEESHEKVVGSVNKLFPYTQELFKPSEVENLAHERGIGADLNIVKGQWEQKVQEIFKMATLDIPKVSWGHEGGKKGIHSEHMGYLLAELQYLQRTYPGAKW